MRKCRLAILLALCLFGLQLKAQNRIAIDYIRKCPLLSPVLLSKVGSDIANSIAEKNIMDIAQVASDSLVIIKTSDISSLSLAVLKMANGSDVIATIFSVKQPEESSVVRFYSTEFIPISADLIDTSLDYSMIMPTNILSSVKKRLIQLMTPMHIVYTFQNNGNILEAKVVVSPSLEDEKDKDTIDAIHRLNKVSYKWNGLQYRLNKD